MSDHPAVPAGAVIGDQVPSGEAAAGQAVAREHDQVLAEDVLVEEVSIDGMCGVY